MRLTDRIEVSYSKGKAKVTMPLTMKMPGRQRKRVPVVLELTMEQADALVDAIKFNKTWVGDGYIHHPWPVDEKSAKKAAKAK